jgi:hypothetical protein
MSLASGTQCFERVQDCFVRGAGWRIKVQGCMVGYAAIKTSDTPCWQKLLCRVGERRWSKTQDSGTALSGTRVHQLET